MNISLRKLQEDDMPLLLKWLSAPHVQKFWDQGIHWSLALVQEKYGSYVKGCKDGKAIYAYTILASQRAVGYVQYYDAMDFPREGYDLKKALQGTDVEDLKLAALDILIGEEEAVGKGIGAAAMRLLLDQYILTKFDGCLVDPDKQNLPAIRAYEKAGFVRLKDMHNTILMIKKRE